MIQNTREALQKLIQNERFEECLKNQYQNTSCFYKPQTGNVVTAMNLGGLKGCIRACEYNLACITYSSHVSLFVRLSFLSF